MKDMKDMKDMEAENMENKRLNPEQENSAKKQPDKRVLPVLKELFLTGYVVLVLLEMDRCLENLFPYTWMGTGNRLIDLWIAFEMRTHALLCWVIPVIFAVWLIRELREGKKPDLGVLLPILLIYAVVLLCSFLADGNVSRWSNTAKYPIIMYLFLTVQCSTRRGAGRLFRAVADLYIVLLLINLAFIVWPSLYYLCVDWRQEFFIGQYNLTGFPMAIGMLLVLMDRQVNGGRVRLILYAVLFYVNLYLIWCATNLIMGAVFAVYLLLPFVRKATEKWNLWAFTGFSLFMFAALMWLLEPVMSWKPMAWFATDVLGQDVTLSLRQGLWSNVLEMVYEKPIIGHGLGDAPAIWQHPGWTSEYVMHAHNCWLQTLYEGGIVYLIAVLVMFFFFAAAFRKLQSRKTAGAAVISLFAVLIMQEANIQAWFVWYPVCMIAQTGILTGHRQDEMLREQACCRSDPAAPAAECCK